MMTTSVDPRCAFDNISNVENIPPVGDRKTVKVPRQPLAERVSMVVLLGVILPYSDKRNLFLQMPPEEPMITDDEERIRRIKDMEKEEPLLQENPRRFVMFPIEHSDIWEFYKKAQGKRSSPPFLRQCKNLGLFTLLCAMHTKHAR